MKTDRRPPQPVAAAPGHLRRVLGLAELTASGVGIIIGAGIYVLLGAATAEAGAAVWLAFVLAALLSAITALSYAELSAMFPKAGGEFEYARHAFPGSVAFVVGWLMTAALVIAAATIALGFARYLETFIAVPSRAAAIALIAAVTLIAGAGIARAGRLAVVLSAIQVGGLLGVIVIGLPHLGQVNLLATPDLGGVVAAAALVFFAFIGFDEVVTLAEETTDPTRTVPRALLLGLGLSTILYVGAAVAAVSVLGPSPLGASTRPLTDVVAHALGTRAAEVVAVVALVTTTNTTLLAVTAASRVLFGMTSGGFLPARLIQVSARTGAPAFALAVVALGAAGCALIGDLTLVASVTDAAVYAVFLVVNAAVIVLRLRRPDLPRPFRTPLALSRVPLLPVLGSGAVLVLLPALGGRALLLGLGLALLGAGLFWTRRSHLSHGAEPEPGAPSTPSRMQSGITRGHSTSGTSHRDHVR